MHDSGRITDHQTLNIPCSLPTIRPKFYELPERRSRESEEKTTGDLR
jgi:hypothetical protein